MEAVLGIFHNLVDVSQVCHMVNWWNILKSYLNHISQIVIVLLKTNHDC